MKKCEDCIFSEIVDWKQDETGKAKPVYWCEKHHIFRRTEYSCTQFVDVNGKETT